MPQAETSDALSSPTPESLPRLGVVLVAFRSADVILDALESLLAATGVRLAIVVVDNASPDDTGAVLDAWSTGRVPYAPSPDLPFDLRPAPKPLPLHAPEAPLPPDGHTVTLIRSGVNGGFAAGVNLGLAHLMRHSEIDRFWVLNPDSAVPRGTPAALARAPEPLGGFGLMGCRILYLDHPDIIQCDGGLVRRWTGVTTNVNLMVPVERAGPLDPARTVFVSGANMVASRRFLETVGLMHEDYFLYYEEVDWAFRRGDLPIVHCPDAVVFHRVGTSIGSATVDRPWSPFSLYFLHRNRLRFLRRHLPWALPTGFGFSVAKAAQFLLRGHRLEAWTVIAGSLGLPPPRSVREKLSPEAQRLAFSR